MASDVKLMPASICFSSVLALTSFLLGYEVTHEKIVEKVLSQPDATYTCYLYHRNNHKQCCDQSNTIGNQH